MGHPATLYGFITGLSVIVCVTVLTAMGHMADDVASAILVGLGGTGLGVAGGVAIPRSVNNNNSPTS